jgi:RNA polymerase sigma factor for flagellar operon FliA
LRALDWVPRAIRQKARELERTQHELEADSAASPPTTKSPRAWGIRQSASSSSLQQRCAAPSVLSLEEHLPNDRGNDIPLLDTLKGDDGDLGLDVEQREIREALVGAVEALSKQERTVIELYYFEGQTLKEIKASSTSRNRASRRSTRKPSSTCARSCAYCAATSATARTIRRSNRSTFAVRRPSPGSEAVH